MEKFDVVIFGPTSFVGKQVVQHFLDTYGVNGAISWAIAGRSAQKMAALIETHGNRAFGLKMIIADANDLYALKQMCEQTKVVITMAGPYALYGEKVLQACAETGTDYCDLTGEVPWVADMMAKFSDTAKQTGARIINFCGFDSIPSDMGVYFLQQEAIKRFGMPCTHVKGRVIKMKGNAPIGTYNSAIDGITKSTKSASYRAKMNNHYLLCPKDHRFSVKQDNAIKPKYDKDFKQWSTVWVMANINTRVVHRSNALFAERYGNPFYYEESMLVGDGIAGRVRAYAVVGMLSGVIALVAFSLTRKILTKFIIPKISESADAQTLSQFGYEIQLHGRTQNDNTLKISVTGKGDPAVISTSRMISEAGICLATEISKSEKSGGFWSTASIFEDKLINRLQQHAQMTFDVMPDAL